MQTLPKIRALLLSAAVWLLALAMVSCQSRYQYLGTYTALPGTSPVRAETVLELKANGQGTWKVRDEEVPFSWYVKGDELRLNTRGGGVIVGSLHGDDVRITLPGSGQMAFKKSK
jgi:hypothetical protein